MRASRANALLIGVLVLLVSGLAVLATLQFRWIDQVSAAEELRMRASLQLAARQFASDLQGEIGEIFRAFGGREDEDLAEREEEWRRNAAHPNLVERVYVDSRLEDQGPPFDSRRLELVFRERGGRPRPPGFDFDRPLERAPDAPHATVVKLSRSELTKAVLPELAHRHFSAGYDIAIVSRDGVLFRTDDAWPDGRTPPDVDEPIRWFGPGPGPGPPREVPRDMPRDMPRDVPRDMPRGMDRFRGQDRGDENAGWHLLVRRHDGGLASVVAAARRRNLAVSVGILAILVSTVTVLLYLLRRADRLREQQTEFVAAISHELNTPVTALRSAGENLKDGIITDPGKLALYGETIVKESARLGDMIEQVLEFAGMRARRNRGASEPVDLAAVVEEAVAQSRTVIDGDAVRIVTDFEPDLPRPRGDAHSLTRAVQNLVANAVRHGGSGGWVGVRVFRVGRTSVAIRVEDRGPGVDSRDAAHLFEPFYRGRGTSAVRGSGLGLTIVQQVVAAHGGSIELDRRRREGAAFTITLPLERNV